MENSDSILGGGLALNTSRLHKVEINNAMHNNNTQGWVGIDVSKDTLDACLLRESGKLQHKQFENSAEGHAKLLRWALHLAQGAALHFALESTGSYSTPLATFLVEQQQKVSVLNPARIKYAALAQGGTNKTDRADARVLADYGRKENPPLWRMATPEVQRRVALVRHRSTLMQQKGQTQNRLDQPLLEPTVQHSLRKMLRFLEAEIVQGEEQIQRHLDNTPSLKADPELLLSIPGIGETTAQVILAELPAVNQFASAQSAAAYAGLNPREYQSGTRVKKRTHLSKRGNAQLRCALYGPAVSAVRFNPLVADLYQRLLDRGKTKMAALGAAMRKLLLSAYGVLKSRRTFTLEAVVETS